MQARSSSDGQLYSWISVSTADWAGASFPGPGDAQHVAVAALVPDSAIQVDLVEAAQVTPGNDVLVLLRATPLTSSQMPANTGDRVAYVANAQTVPTTNPFSGCILYAAHGSLLTRSTTGMVSSV